MKPDRQHTGFALVTVLILTAIGLLFGAGSLLLFKYQCQLRIDRQHELEKVYAVRSALNYIRTANGEINNENNPFRYYTGSGRDLKVIVKPVPRIFPNFSTNHLDMADEGQHGRIFQSQNCHPECSNNENYCRVLDYEFGAVGVTNVCESLKGYKLETGGKLKYGLKFDDLNAAKNVEWWVNIGMRGTGGWLQEDYGRRYYFYPYDYVNESESDGVRDEIRLCIIRNVTNMTAAAEVGCRHGWPLSQVAYNRRGEYLGERALVFQLSKGKAISSSGAKSIMATFSEYCYSNGGVEPIPRMSVDGWPDKGYMGIQIAEDQVTMFYISMSAGLSGGYTFSASTNMTARTYEYFRDEIKVGGVPYPGTNVVNGKVQSPELRVVFDVVASSDKRSSFDFLSNFRVTPAYQYDVFLQQPILVGNTAGVVTNRATVAQKTGEYSRNGTSYTVLTYDTHGTENKGFRMDEREWQRKRGIR